MLKEGQRLMIIKLEIYNLAEELSIEKGNTKSLGLVRHRDTGLDSKRTMVAVRMKGRRVAMRMRDSICSSLSGMRQGLGTMVLWSRRGISKRKHADGRGKTRVGTLKTQVGRGGGLLMRWPVWCMVAHLSCDQPCDN